MCRVKKITWSSYSSKRFKNLKMVLKRLWNSVCIYTKHYADKTTMINQESHFRHSMKNKTAMTWCSTFLIKWLHWLQNMHVSKHSPKDSRWVLNCYKTSERNAYKKNCERVKNKLDSVIRLIAWLKAKSIEHQGWSSIRRSEQTSKSDSTHSLECTAQLSNVQVVDHHTKPLTGNLNMH